SRGNPVGRCSLMADSCVERGEPIGLPCLGCAFGRCDLGIGAGGSMSKTEVLEKIDAHTMSPVRVSLPASVAADLGRLKKAFGNVLEQLGCPGCCSGRDILWEIQQDFSLDKDLKAAPQALRSGSKKSDAKALRVGISPR